MTKVWARELGRKGICVNAVAPGLISTDMLNGVPEKVLHQLNGRIPLGRMGRPEELAGVYVFLASKDADYINGAVLSVDGQAPINLMEDDHIDIRAAEVTAQFVCFGDPGYFYRNLTAHMNENSLGLPR